MDQWWSMLASLPEDPNLTPVSTWWFAVTMVVHLELLNLSGFNNIFLFLCASVMRVMHTHTCRQNTHSAANCTAWDWPDQGNRECRADRLTDRDREYLGLSRWCAQMEVSQPLETQCVYYTAEGEGRLPSLGREAGSDCSHHPQEGAVLGISYTSCQHTCSDHGKA